MQLLLADWEHCGGRLSGPQSWQPSETFQLVCCSAAVTPDMLCCSAAVIA
jgi:hypothetical protein